MSEVRAFFRFCPSCGRRFHIRLVSKKLVGERKEVTAIKEAIGSFIPTSVGRSIVVEENIPATIDVEEFQYAYKCKHCGHAWSERRVEESRV